MRKLFLILIVVSILLAGCEFTWPPESPLPTPTPTPAPVPTADIEYTTPVLLQGTALDQADVLSLAVLAVPNECVTEPLVFDVRSDDDPSLGTLPRLSEGDYQALKAFYNFQERDEYGCTQAKPGQLYWDLYAVEFKCGPAVLQPQTRNENGTKADGILMFLHWPGAEQFPVVVDPPYSQYGVTAWTDGGGSVGWGYGGESHIGPDGGPYLTWASSDPVDWPDRRIGSDALDKIGWWDNHCTPNPIFKTTRKEGAVPPTDGYQLVDTDEVGNEIGYILFQTNTPPVNTRLLLLRSPEGVDLGHVPWNLD